MGIPKKEIFGPGGFSVLAGKLFWLLHHEKKGLCHEKKGESSTTLLKEISKPFSIPQKNDSQCLPSGEGLVAEHIY